MTTTVAKEWRVLGWRGTATLPFYDFTFTSDDYDNPERVAREFFAALAGEASHGGARPPELTSRTITTTRWKEES